MAVSQGDSQKVLGVYRKQDMSIEKFIAKQLKKKGMKYPMIIPLQKRKIK